MTSTCVKNRVSSGPGLFLNAASLTSTQERMLGREAARAPWLRLHGRAGPGCPSSSLILFSQTLQLRAAESSRRLLNTAWVSRAVHTADEGPWHREGLTTATAQAGGPGCHLGARQNTSAVCRGLCCPRVRAEEHRPPQKAARPLPGSGEAQGPAAGAAPLGRWVRERVPSGAPRVLMATPSLGVPRGGGHGAPDSLGTIGNRFFL